MEISTTRFGVLEISQERELVFPKGMLGFPERTRYCLLQPSEESCFFWLQSLEVPELAFVVTDPACFVPDYTAPIREDQAKAIGLHNLQDAQVLVVVNKVDGALTGNLQGPLVLNAAKCLGEQVVLAEKRWTTRHVLVPAAAVTNANPSVKATA